MELTLLGTGCPQVDLDRFGPASLVRHEDLTFLIDCGSGVTQRLLGAGSSGARIDALFLTHLHSDHLVDLFQLILSSWHQGRDCPQRIFGPPGTKVFCDGLMALWAGELAQRIAHEQRPSTRALELDVTEFGPGEIWADDTDVRVRAFEVDHRPVQHAYGFIFEAGGQSSPSAATRRCARADRGSPRCRRSGTRVLHPWHDARNGQPLARGSARVAAITPCRARSARWHGRPAARCLVLNHFVPVKFDQAALHAEVRRDYAAPIVIGEDLLSLDVGSGETP